MKGKKMKGVLAALLTGAMVLSMPTAALAYTYVDSYTTINSAVPTVTGLGIKSEKGTEYLVWNPLTLESGGIGIEYSTDKTFPDTNKTNTGWVDTTTAKKGKIDINDWLYDMESGNTYYIRTVVNDYNKGYGAYSSVISYTKEVKEPSVSESTVTSTSVNFLLDADGATGFEISRKIGSKWKVIATISDNTYTDTGLKSGKTYSYRFRSYVFNKDTKTKVYSKKYKYVTKATWGSSLNVKATATSSTKVKVTWKKVAGASGYKVYRALGGNSGLWDSKGQSRNFANYKLVKTIKKAKTVSFTDKKLTPGQTYTYKVVAYKNKTKTTPAMTIDGDYYGNSDSVTLAFDGWENSGYKEYANSNGSITATWKKILGAQGYIIEREGKKADGTWDYIQVGTLGASATSYTFVPVDSENWHNDYLIWVYSGNEYDSQSAEPTLIKVQAPGSIKAVADNANGSIQVSWAPVAGAAYYQVYRSTRLTGFNPNNGNYDYYGSYKSLVAVQTKAGTEGVLSADGKTIVTSPVAPETDNKIKGTTVTDKYIGYTYFDWDNAAQKYVSKVQDMQDGPAAGIHYYYYVRAYKANGTPIDEDDYYDYDSSAYTKPGTAIITNTTVAKPAIKKVTAGKKKATVTWKKVAGAEKYLVYVSAKKNKGYSLAGVTTKTKLTVTGLTSGKTRYFKVKAVKSNEAGADAYSALSAAKGKKIK